MEDILTKIDKVWNEKILSEYRQRLYCENNEQLKRECEYILELIRGEE